MILPRIINYAGTVGVEKPPKHNKSFAFIFKSFLEAV